MAYCLTNGTVRWSSAHWFHRWPGRGCLTWGGGCLLSRAHAADDARSCWVWSILTCAINHTLTGPLPPCPPPPASKHESQTQCWPRILDGGPTLNQHLVIVLCCLFHSAWSPPALYHTPHMPLSSLATTCEHIQDLNEVFDPVCRSYN